MLRNISIKKEQVGYLLLLVAFFAGCFTLYSHLFVDEADNLTIGSLLANGQVLYRDVFTHHFPFPYYWVAGIVSLFGKSLLAARLSLWAFQILVLGILMHLSRRPLAIGLAALVWAVFRHHYWGNLVLYDAFSATALMALFVITLLILENQLTPRRRHLWLFGGLVAVALYSDPRTVLAIGMILLFTGIKDYKIGLRLGLYSLACLSAYGLYLILSGTLTDFVENALLFNIFVYGKYTSTTSSLRVEEFINSAIRLLGLFRPEWYNWDPFKPLSLDYDIDRWVFTGVFYRLSFILFTVQRLLNRKFLSGFFAYLFATALVVISSWSFHAQPFVLTAITASLLLMPVERDSSPGWLHVSQKAAASLLAICLAWVGVRSTLHIIQNPQLNSFEQNFTEVLEDVQRVKKWSCGETNVRLLDYPGGPGLYLYWFTDLKPTSKYLYLWPWVADVGLEETLRQISAPGALVITLREKNGELQNLEPLLQLLNRTYQRTGNKLHLSPALAQKCQKLP